MKCLKFTGTIALVMLALTLLSSPSLYAQPFDITSYTIDSGGGTSSANGFEIQGTIGQPDAGPALVGGTFTLSGGFWTALSEQVIPGDLNGDGVANLLDVAPFVDAVTSGTFSPEADINSDGVVNLLDVAPFVELLTGG